MAAKPKLTYFPLRALGEVTRLMFHDAKVDFEDNRVDFKDWPSQKATAPYGQMPLLTVGNTVIAQSGAIERYVAKLTKLYGADALQAAQIDMVVEGVNEARKDFFSIQFNKSADERKAKYDAYFKDQFPRWGSQLSAILKGNAGGKGYFVGNDCTYADIHFYRFISEMRDVNADAFEAYPELSALIDRVAARPAIAAWIKARPASDH